MNQNPPFQSPACIKAIRRALALTALLSFLALPGFSFAQSKSLAVRDKNVEAQLLSSVTSIQPGVPFTLALKLKIDPTWHTYWKNPGETGIPTGLKLDLPDGFTAGNLQFPVPKRFITDFGYNIVEAGFGYVTEVVHPITITPPADLPEGRPVKISGTAEWLMCDPGTCVPGKAGLSLSLNVSGTASPSPVAAEIEKYSAKIPKATAWETAISLEGEKVIVTVAAENGILPEKAKIHLYPDEKHILDQLSEPEISQADGKLIFAFKKYEVLESAPERFSGLLVAETEAGRQGFKISTEAAGAEASLETASTDQSNKATAPVPPADLPFGGGLLGILLAAFLGGIILNIMPCVFPVISLKVMSFVGQSGEDRKKILAHSLTFALGILVFFWLLTIMLIVLRFAGSDDVGWGVQLRQPGFVIGLIFVMVLVALSLFGVFELGTSMTSVGGNLANKSGYAGSFWSGALAVLLATPCTAPLMAPAIGFALVQPDWVMFLVFTTLGLGLAAPYFIFAIFPKLLDVIPPPGAWMETFKQFMGFPMLAVVVWLSGVLSKQLSVGGLQWALASVLIASFAAWIYGRFAGFSRPLLTRIMGKIVAVLVFALSLYVAFDASKKRAPASNLDIREVIASHRAEGKDVFVDFTAEWCLTCKVNERVAIKTDAVQDAFKENNVEFVIADWTNKNSSIAALLEEHGRAGVPLYLLYPADKSKPAIMLKEGILTPGDILEAIENLK